MDRRDVFDLVLVVVLLALVYVARYDLTRPAAQVEAVVDALLGLGLVVYLVLGTVAGAAFVAYIAVYRPRKDSRGRPSRQR